VWLTPKYVFFGIVVLGLPLAVTVGWVLGTPSVAPIVASAPGGAGGMGAAPPRAESPQPGAADGYSSRSRPGSGPSAAPVSVPPVSAAPPAATAPATSPTVTRSSPPELTLPPVPTPTDITVSPSSPSATPSDGPPPWDHMFGGARWVRRQ
jgi:hypothetical protein